MSTATPPRTAHVLVVDPVSTGRMYAPLLLAAGATVSEVLTPRSARLGRPPAHPGLSHRVVLADGVEVGDVVERCRTWGVDRVVAGSEPGVPLVALLDRALRGVELPAAGGRALYDKAATAQALERDGVPALASAALSSLEQGDAFFDEFDFTTGSLVLKPTVSAGSVGVVRVDSAPAAARALRGLLGGSSSFGEPVDLVLAQEFIGGEEYVVDTYSYGGRHTVANVCVYTKVLSRAGHFVYRGVRWLPPDAPEVRQVVDHTRAVLDAVGRTDGCTHLEIIADGDRLRLIDLGARAHGAGHPEKTYLLTGDSQVHREVAHLVHGTVPPDDYTLARRGRIVFFDREERSVVVREDPAAAFDGVPAVESLTLLVQPGDVVPPTVDLADGLAIGMCFLVADSEHELDAAEEQVRHVVDGLFAPVP
ncbi:ATP-grasp domain-containing protein [Cellulomonas phragmiteti]|uniref:ATP-grasp domain-containing protein n=1 Tax=Cellulomonas phragmiteti TaxID=478780 RepID=A0ABQ4DNP9_9CELL|nr:ATP-grasp domain-containing protein [Cellulomonas phragmiteti]GIG40977.1 hypothetical protein Cph01nite_27390 [Cellulomonas phragmiteti]